MYFIGEDDGGIGFQQNLEQLECISTVSYSVMINGEPHGFIKPTRGTVQQCPVSSLQMTRIIFVVLKLVSAPISGNSSSVMKKLAVSELILISQPSFSARTLLLCVIP